MRKLNIDKQRVIELFNQGLCAEKIGNLLGFKRGVIEKRLLEWGFRRSNSFYRKKKHFNESFFKKINTEEKAYWLGFLMADGNVQERGGSRIIKIAVRDKEICDKFLKSINADFETQTYFQKDSYNPGYVQDVYVVSIYSKEMFDDLSKYGCVPKKSLILQFPKLSKKYVRHFIRGYFDGDGYITYGIRKSGGLYSSVGFNGTFEFLTKLNTYIPNPGTIFKEKRINSNTYRIHKSGHNNTKQFFDYFYKDSTIYLERKYLKFIDYFNNKKDVQRV